MDAGRMAKAPNRLTARVEIPAACGGRKPNKVSRGRHHIHDPRIVAENIQASVRRMRRLDHPVDVSFFHHVGDHTGHLTSRRLPRAERRL